MYIIIIVHDIVIIIILAVCQVANRVSCAALFMIMECMAQII